MDPVWRRENNEKSASSRFTVTLNWVFSLGFDETKPNSGVYRVKGGPGTSNMEHEQSTNISERATMGQHHSNEIYICIHIYMEHPVPKPRLFVSGDPYLAYQVQ